MIQIVFKGKFSFDNSKASEFIKDIEKLIATHGGNYEGAITSFQFDDCEVIEDETDNN